MCFYSEISQIVGQPVGLSVGRYQAAHRSASAFSSETSFANYALRSAVQLRPTGRQKHAPVCLKWRAAIGVNMPRSVGRFCMADRRMTVHFALFSVFDP